MQKLLSSLRSLFTRAHSAQSSNAAAEPGIMLREIRIAMRLAMHDEAQKMIARLQAQGGREAECWNLLGAIHEARREWKAAKRCYGRAIRSDRRYAPAQHNMRRIYELYTFGHSAKRVALGDESSDEVLRDWQRRSHFPATEQRDELSSHDHARAHQPTE